MTDIQASPRTGTTRSEPVKRTSEIEELSNLYVIHPISSRLTPIFARLGITPNAVSLTGMSSGVAAGFAYAHGGSFAWACTGFALMIAWHVFDGVDGQLARLTNSQSPFGKVLDGICDYSTFLSVYVGLGVTLARQHGAWVWGVIAVSAICHAVQSAAYEIQRQDYEFWGMGKASADMLGSGEPVSGPTGRTLLRTLTDGLNHFYGQLQLRAAGIDVGTRRRLTATMNIRPDRGRAFRLAYREMFAPRVRLWSVMSANMRTLGIFVFAALKVPLYYFCFEASVLSMILAALMLGQRPLYAAFIARLEAAE